LLLVTTELTLGTSLRRLIGLLDGEVDRAYADAGLDFRAAFTPAVRALLASEPLSVRDVASATGTTHSAASQTVAQLKRAGLVIDASSRDGRERRVRLSAHGCQILPAVQAQWRRADQAAAALDAELGLGLNDVIQAAIEALDRHAFLTRAPVAEAEGRDSHG
jgi:DNA-binding MarR family transcriptional regulator